MIWVGVTGGIGCGKSTAVSIFEKLGFGVVSADRVVHELYESPVVQAEVSSILKLENGFSKGAVAQAVFGDKEKLQVLEAYIHPLVREQTDLKKTELEQGGRELSFYEIPLLFEKKMQDRFDFTICVGADKKTQVDRIKKRNNWSDEEIQKRIAAQFPLEEKRKLADFYIDNSGDLDALEEKCQLTVEKIKDAYSTKN